MCLFVYVRICLYVFVCVFVRIRVCVFVCLYIIYMCVCGYILRVCVLIWLTEEERGGEREREGKWMEEKGVSTAKAPSCDFYLTSSCA